MTVFRLPKWAEPIAASKLNYALVVVVRLLVGFVFVFSGFVKGIDPWGGYYKFMEYFNAYGLGQLVPASLAASFALAAVEFVMGVCIAVGAFRRGAVTLALLMMLVMTPLTLDLAISGRVPDCGCFGDAVVLSNWQTFWKNVILLPLIVYLLFFNRRVHGIYGPAVNWMVAALSLAYVGSVAYEGYFKQPLLDFRPYKVGAKIGVATANQVDENDYVFVYERDGQRQAFSIDSVPAEGSGWNYVERHFKEGKEPQSRMLSQGVTIMEDGADVTEDVLPDTGRQLVYLFPDLAGVNISYTFNLNQLAEHAAKQDCSVFAVTSADTAAIARWNDISYANYPIYQMDDSEIKTVARGNPAVVLVENGIVKWKRTLVSLDSERLRNDQYPIEQLNDGENQEATLHGRTGLYALCLLALLVINRTHVLILAFYRLFKHKRAKERHPLRAEDGDPDKNLDIKKEQDNFVDNEQ